MDEIDDWLCCKQRKNMQTMTEHTGMVAVLILRPTSWQEENENQEEGESNPSGSQKAILLFPALQVFILHYL